MFYVFLCAESLSIQVYSVDYDSQRLSFHFCLCTDRLDDVEQMTAQNLVMERGDSVHRVAVTANT